ncbi:MAG: hypothetical protein U5O39_13440 [Gammaproteobacteria bacterium]|nr:hypothetical protein [Gammaproteobacteria bacterium]
MRRRVEERTDGRVKFKIYPGGVQGDDYTARSARCASDSSMGAVSSSSLTRFYPDSAGANGCRSSFQNFDEVDYVRERMDQRIIDGLRAAEIVKSFCADGNRFRLFADGYAGDEPR